MTGKGSVFSLYVIALLLCVAQCGGKEEGRAAPSSEGVAPAASSEAVPGSLAATKADAVRLKTVPLIDREGTGIEALRVLIPSDWQCQGQVRWLLDMPFMPAVVMLRATSPDGSAEFELLPNQTFVWTENQMTQSVYPPGSRYFGAEVMQPISAQAALRSLVLQRYRSDVSGLAVVKEEPMPELRQVAYAAIVPEPGLSVNVDAAKTRVTYNRGGREYEEQLCAAVECFSYQTQTMYGPINNTNWYVDYAFTFKADKGKLDNNAPILSAIAESVKVNPVWLSKYTQLRTWLNQQQIERIQSVGQLSQMLSQTSNEVSDMMMDSYKKREAANDRIAQGWSDYTLGIDRYNDPIAGKEVEVYGGYKYNYSNGQGTYWQTDDPNFNPNVDVGSNQNWELLTK